MIENRSLVTGTVTENHPAAPDHFLLTVRLPLTFASPAPGQFVMVREASRREPLLARPLSVMGFTRRNDHAVLELLYHVAGRGTALLSRIGPGGEIAVLGPLGRGFTRPDRIRRALFVAGGVGVAPLLYLLHSPMFASQESEAGGTGPEKVFYLGARTEKLLAGLDRLKGRCTLGICTDDGSLGHHGPVTDLLKRDMGGYDPEDTVIYACGPTPMVRALGRVLGEHPVPCQVSLEERMACGLGACLGCAVAVRNPEGKREYRRVCHDGPVFDLKEILPEFPRIA